MKFKVPFVFALLLAMVGLVAAAPAQASDAQLRKVVKQQEKKSEPATKKFVEVAESIEDPSDLEEVQQASEELRSALATYRKAVTPVKTSSSKGKQGKTKLLSALKEMTTGLTQFESFIDKAQGGASKSELESARKKFQKHLDKSEKLGDEALELLGIESAS